MSSQFPSVITIPISRLKKMAPNRPAGYLEDVISCGVLKEGFLVLSREEHRRLRHKYNPPPQAHEPNCPDCAGRTSVYIPEDPDLEKNKKEADRRSFRKAFLGPLENVPPHVLHLRLAMEDRRTQLTAEGCSGCKLGSVLGEFSERAYRHHLRSLRVRG